MFRWHACLALTSGKEKGREKDRSDSGDFRVLVFDEAVKWKGGAARNKGVRAGEEEEVEVVEEQEMCL